MNNRPEAILTSTTASKEAKMNYLMRELTRAVNVRLDSGARSRDYRDITEAASFHDDPNPKFAAEGKAFKEWRSACWTAYEAVIHEASIGGVFPESIAKALERLPRSPTF